MKKMLLVRAWHGYVKLPRVNVVRFACRLHSQFKRLYPERPISLFANAGGSGIVAFYKWCVIIILSLFSPGTLLGQGQQQEERINGWKSDIDTFLHLIKQQHYVYKTKPLPQQLLTNAATLKTNIAQYSDERMLSELERLAWHMHDGHSYVLPVSPKINAFYLPVQFYLFSDGAYIIDAEEPYKDLIGCKVVSINHCCRCQAGG